MAWFKRLLGGWSGRRDMDALLATFGRRGVTRIACVHCVQFAPWRTALLDGRREAKVAEDDAERVERFLAKAAQNAHQRRLTLFYQPHLVPAHTRSRPDVRAAAAGDPIGFGRAGDAAIARRAAAMRQVAAAGHDVQVALDPTGMIWTALLNDDEPSVWLARPEVRARDAARFELAVQLVVQTVRVETGLPLATWLFSRPDHVVVHGNTLAQDVPDEIAILARAGCIGDFSAYRGPPAADSDVARPFLVRPLAGSRMWEAREAEPEWAWGNGWAAAEKLLIWSPAPKPDGRDPGVPSDPMVRCLRLIEGGMIVDDQLWLTVRSQLSPPHEYGRSAIDPPAEDAPMLDVLAEVAKQSGLTTRHLTAAEAYGEFIADSGPPPEGWMITLPAKISERRGTGHLVRRDVIGLLAIDEVMSSIRDMGLKKSGATEFYRGRAEKGQMLALYEGAIAELLVALRPRIGHAYEVGSGASVLTMLLAANGIAATGIDRQPHRIGLAQRILKRVEETGGPLPAPRELKRGSAPQALRRIDGRDAALIFTNMIGPLSDSEETELIKRAADFRIVIVDLARFVRVRDGAGQSALLARFAAAGLGAPLLLAGFSSFRVFVRALPD